MIDQETLGASIAYTKAHGGGGGGGDVTGVKGNAESTYRKGNVNITPANIGLGNVDNTSDLNKPISTATQSALDAKVDKVTGKGLSENDYTDADKAIVGGVTSALADKVDKVAGKGLSTNDYDNTAKGIVDGVTSALAGKVDTSLVGSANGVAELDANGRVPSSQLPSYVDDVLEYADLAHFPATGETGKIYIAEDTNKTYRWSGSDYAEISESLALGETSSTAYAGNKGKANADAIAGIKNGTSINSFSAVETALQSYATNTHVDDLVGNLSAATTTDKSSVVAMVNEVNEKIGNLSTGNFPFYPIVAQNDIAAVNPPKANSYSIVSLTILGNSTEIPEATGGVTDGYIITFNSATDGYLHIGLVGSYASVNRGNCLNLVLNIT